MSTPLNRTTSLLFSLLLSTSLFAQLVPSVTPNVGSTLGGEEVFIRANFGTQLPSVFFGWVAAPFTERVDATTIRVITPPHLPGLVDISLFDHGLSSEPQLTFTFVGEYPEEAYERVLLPIFTAPVAGANGSEFHSALRVMNTSDTGLHIYGLRPDCIIATCAPPPLPSLEIHPREDRGEPGTGNPGLFVYLPRARRDDLVTQLRAYDVSREATNFGTEIPVVYEEEMTSGPVTLLGVPTDSRFRNTLRIYAMYGMDVDVVVENDTLRQMHHLQLRAPLNIFDPGYTMFDAFPSDVGPVRVTITYVPPVLVDPPPPPQPLWAFISVTNNDTQHITVISPQR